MPVALEWAKRMADTAMNKGIVNSWSLISFARAHGMMKIIPCTNGETGEMFKACGFVNPADQSVTFVSFSSKLGELTPQEIKERKDTLQVVELTPSVDPQTGEERRHYSLCNKGENSWEDVDIF